MKETLKAIKDKVLNHQDNRKSLNEKRSKYGKIESITQSSLQSAEIGIVNKSSENRMLKTDIEQLKDMIATEEAKVESHGDTNFTL